MNYIEEITRIARENINKADDAGCGMYNFPLDVPDKCEWREGFGYNSDTIIQVYPYKENAHYGMIFFLLYDGCGDHEDVSWRELSETEKDYIFGVFKSQIEDKKKIKLKSFVKKDLNYEEKIRIIESWEEDRGSDCENIYDLEDDTDAKGWINLYGVSALYHCRSVGRYWMGGGNFEYSESFEGRKNNKPCVYYMSEADADKMLVWLLDDIADRFEDYMSEDNTDDIKDYQESYYHNLIDFESYYYEKHKKYFVWEASSEDGNFTDKSETLFDTEIEAYNSMRNAALEKMKWNTEWYDVDTESSIGYQVHFSKDKIVHESYSGIYTYKVRLASVEEIKG